MLLNQDPNDVSAGSCSLQEEIDDALHAFYMFYVYAKLKYIFNYTYMYIYTVCKDIYTLRFPVLYNVMRREPTKPASWEATGINTIP